MSKMFVHYNGTVEAFKAAGLETTYNKHIVFIKGGADGTGQAIYTHGEYYGNLNEALTALLAKVNDLKYFSQVKVNDALLSASAANSILSFLAALGQTELVKIDGNEKGVTIGLAKEFVDKVNTDLPTAINTEKERSEAADLAINQLVGTRADKAPATLDKEKATAFERIATLELDLAGITGGPGSVSQQISDAIGNLNLTKTGGDFVKSVEQANGKISAEVQTFEAAGVAMKSYVDAEVEELGGGIQALGNHLNQQLGEKATKLELSGVQSGIAQQIENITNTVANNDTNVRKDFAAADAETLQAAKNYAAGLFGEGSDFLNLAGRVLANETAIGVLNGNSTTEGSVDKKIADAINAFAGSADGDNVIENVTELLNYVNGVDGSLTLDKALGLIADNKGKIETLNGDSTVTGSVAKTVADAVAAEAGLRLAADIDLGKRIEAIVAEGTGTIDAKVAAAVNAEKERAMEAEEANSDAISGVDDRVAAIEKDYLKAADKTELSNKISALEGVAGAGQIAAALAAAEAAQSTADGAVATANANKAAIEAMDLAEVSGYVKSIKQEDGKVSATAVANIPASDVTVADAADNFTGTNVESVLAELAAMWAWEEIPA